MNGNQCLSVKAEKNAVDEQKSAFISEGREKCCKWIVVSGLLGDTKKNAGNEQKSVFISEGREKRCKRIVFSDFLGRAKKNTGN